MKVRYKDSGIEAWSSSFNVHAMSEVLTGDDSPFIKDLDVQLPSGEWKDMIRAFKDKDILPDNYNIGFAPPLNEACKERGYNP